MNFLISFELVFFGKVSFRIHDTGWFSYFWLFLAAFSCFGILSVVSTAALSLFPLHVICLFWSFSSHIFFFLLIGPSVSWFLFPYFVLFRRFLSSLAEVFSPWFQ